MRALKPIIEIVLLLAAVTAWCLIATGCQSSEMAKQDLARIQGLQADLQDNHARIEDLLIRYSGDQLLRAEALKAKLAMVQDAQAAQTARDANGAATIPLATAIKAIDSMVEACSSGQAQIENMRAQSVFLLGQSERLKAMTLSLAVYIQGKQSIIELLRARWNANKAADSAATASASRPAAGVGDGR